MPIIHTEYPRWLGRCCGVVAGAMLSGTACVHGQGASLGFETQAEQPAGVVVFETLSEDEIEQRLHLKEVERELRILRRQHFGSRNTEIRQIGIASLRKYNHPEYYPLLLDVFARDRADVRVAILDMLMETRTEQSDATLAWVAVFDDTIEIREAAAHRLGIRLTEAGGPGDRVLYVLLAGLEQDQDGPPTRSSQLIRQFQIPEMIPYMIQAQAPTPRVARERTGNLANIVIGRQIAFVSDLQPVVANGAVGFDPTLGVVTEGVVLGIQDAVVTTAVFRPLVHRNLVDLTTELWGRPTQQFAYDRAAWERWYRNEFRPFWIAQMQEVEFERAQGDE